VIHPPASYTSVVCRSEGPTSHSDSLMLSGPVYRVGDSTSWSYILSEHAGGDDKSGLSVIFALALVVVVLSLPEKSL
jgi:hypothetical protein